MALSPEDLIIYNSTYKTKTSQLPKTRGWVVQNVLSHNQQEPSEDKAKAMIKDSIAPYKNKKVNIEEEARVVIENNMAESENTTLLSISHIYQGHKSDNNKANEAIKRQIIERYNEKGNNEHHQVFNIAYLLPLNTLLTKLFDSLSRCKPWF